VRSANVNLATEMAVVWAVPEDEDAKNWKLQLGEKLANQLTTCGYKSNLRGIHCYNLCHNCCCSHCIYTYVQMR
jgi:hypothetical protein